MRVRDYKKEYARELELHPNLNKDNHKRIVKRHPDTSKIRYKQKLQKNPEHNKCTIRFKHKSINLGINLLNGRCEECLKYVSMTHIHHDKYDWNDVLAHTRELCASCHLKFHRRNINLIEVNKPKTDEEMKIWNKISWVKFYHLHLI